MEPSPVEQLSVELREVNDTSQNHDQPTFEAVTTTSITKRHRLLIVIFIVSSNMVQVRLDRLISILISFLMGLDDIQHGWTRRRT